MRDRFSFSKDQVCTIYELDLAYAKQNTACELVELFEERIDFMDELVLLAILLERYCCFLFFSGLLEVDKGIQFMNDGVVLFFRDFGYLRILVDGRQVIVHIIINFAEHLLLSFLVINVFELLKHNFRFELKFGFRLSGFAVFLFECRSFMIFKW